MSAFRTVMKSAIEIYAAEALTRYISGMFYALLISMVLILSTIILLYIDSGKIITGLIVILFAYFLSFMAVMSHFRFIRMKEVGILFAASFKNKEIFISDKTGSNSEEGHAHRTGEEPHNPE